MYIIAKIYDFRVKYGILNKGGVPMHTRHHASLRADCSRLINEIHVDCKRTHTIITSEVFAFGHSAIKLIYREIADIYETKRTNPYHPVTAVLIVPGGQVLIMYDYFDFSWRRIVQSVHYVVPDFRVVTIMLPEECS